MKIKAKSKRGYVGGFRGKWHKATEEELKWYEKSFGKKWVDTYIGQL